MVSVGSVGHAARPSVVFVVALALFIATLTLYTATLMPGIGFIDAGELVAATTTLGIVHPTGYPLYTIVGYLATNFLPFGSDPAWRLNFLSAFFGALAVSFSFVLVYRMLVLLTGSQGGRERRQSRATEPTPASAGMLLAIAAAAAGLLGASHTFWLWAVQAKAYTLHATFVAALLLAALRAALPSAPSLRSLHVFAFVFGLAFTNHTMTVLVVPALAVLVVPALVRAHRAGLLGARAIATLAAAAALPLLVYVYLPIRARQQPLMNWGAPSDWPSFVRHVTGWQYRSFLLDSDLPLATKLGGALGLWARQFHPLLGAPLAVLALGGMARLWVGARPWLVATVLVAGMQLGFGISFGTTPEIHESYFVPFYMMVMLWIAAGSFWIWELLRRRVSAWVVASLVLVLPLLAVATNYRRNDHHADHLAPKFIENVFRELGEGALVVTDLWELVSGSFYFQHVRGMRPDVTIIDINSCPLSVVFRFPPAPSARSFRAGRGRRASLPAAPGSLRQRPHRRRVAAGRFSRTTSPSSAASYGIIWRGDDPSTRSSCICMRRASSLRTSSRSSARTSTAGLTARVVGDRGPYMVRAPEWDLAGITSDPVPKDRIATYICTLYPAALTAIGRSMEFAGHKAEGNQLLAEAARVRCSASPP